MATYTDRITLVFPIAAKNRQAAASLQTLEITESGNEFEKLVPLDPSLVSQYASAFNLPLLERVTQLETDLATKTSQLEAVTQAKTALDLQVTQLETDLATKTSQLEAVTQAKTALDLQVATLTNEKESLTSQVSMLEAVIEAGKQKIADLEQYRPYNPRILAGKAFYRRVSKEDMVTLLTSEIPQLVVVGKTIVAYAENDWPVIIDSTDFQNLVGYVLQSGVFDESEVVEIMRDATREEAYTVPE